MDQNEKVANDKISKLENEIKVLKNEVQAVLLDLRESYLNMQNPFNAAPASSSVQPIVINQQAPGRETGSETPDREESESEQLPPTRKTRRPAVEQREEEDGDPAPISARVERANLQTRKDNFPAPRLPSRSESLITCEADLRKNMRLDLITMAGLTGWVELSVKKIGQKRSEAVLDISQLMGYISPDLKNILLKLIALAPQDREDNSAGMRDYVDSLAKLNALLGGDSSEASALQLLSLITEDSQHG
jgi:archaellum component FlaD/FlaE